jgi:two-component system, response regulator YesN
MKLLLVEDERLTREGILESVDWMRLQITEVREAVDGMDALAAAELYAPDIVLTDIRMPRMEGVSLAFQLRRKFPNCKIVFMSGYADKEYLKAAITLKAVSYVEKPLDVDELEDALAKAVAEYEAERKQLQLLSLSAEKAYLVKRQIARTLTRSQWEQEAMRQELALLDEAVTLNSCAVTCVIRLALEHPELEELEQWLEASLAEYQVTPLMFAKDDVHVVLHLITSERYKLTPAKLRDGLSTFVYELRTRKVIHDISAGNPVEGLSSLHESYMTAALLLQSSFYRGPYSMTIFGDQSGSSSSDSSPDLKYAGLLQAALTQESYEEYERLLRQLSAELRRAPSTPVNQVKELYYRLVQEMDHFFQDAGISGETESLAQSALWDQMSKCHYLSELQELVIAKLSFWKQAWEKRQSGQGYISSKIMRYVHHHYANDDLSVQEISDHLQLTTSYIISVFKEETGRTVKQFLLEYRMEKARELLKDRNLKVADIAGQVGFKDGEYFAKVFRKFTGMTPSEYRERFQ